MDLIQWLDLMTQSWTQWSKFRLDQKLDLMIQWMGLIIQWIGLIINSWNRSRGWIWWPKSGLDPAMEREDPVVRVEFLGITHPESGNFGAFGIKSSPKTQNLEILLSLGWKNSSFLKKLPIRKFWCLWNLIFAFPKNPKVGNFAALGIKFFFFQKPEFGNFWCLWDE